MSLSHTVQKSTSSRPIHRTHIDEHFDNVEFVAFVQHSICIPDDMAKYGKAAGRRVKSAMHRKKRGTLKSGSGRKVRSRKQAIAIGLSEARKKGAKVPRKRSRKRS
jgi:hypothetical protein